MGEERGGVFDVVDFGRCCEICVDCYCYLLSSSPVEFIKRGVTSGIIFLTIFRISRGIRVELNVTLFLITRMMKKELAVCATHQPLWLICVMAYESLKKCEASLRVSKVLSEFSEACEAF